MIHHKKNHSSLRRKIIGTPFKSPPCKLFKQLSTPSKSPCIKRLKKNITFHVFPSASKCPSVSFEIIQNDKVLKCQNDQLESKIISEKCTGLSKSRRALLERFEDNSSISYSDKTGMIPVDNTSISDSVDTADIQALILKVLQQLKEHGLEKKIRYFLRIGTKGLIPDQQHCI